MLWVLTLRTSLQVVFILKKQRTYGNRKKRIYVVIVIVIVIILTFKVYFDNFYYFVDVWLKPTTEILVFS